MSAPRQACPTSPRCRSVPERYRGRDWKTTARRRLAASGRWRNRVVGSLAIASHRSESTGLDPGSTNQRQHQPDRNRHNDKSLVQKGPNKDLGGSQERFATVPYHPSTTGVVAMAPRPPPPKQTTMKRARPVQRVRFVAHRLHMVSRPLSQRKKNGHRAVASPSTS